MEHLTDILSNDDAEFMSRLLGNSSLSNELSSGFSSTFFPSDDSITPTYPHNKKFQMYPLSDNTNTNNIFFYSYSQDNSYGTDESYYLNETTHESSFSFGLTNNNNRSSVSSYFPLHGKHLHITMESDLPLPQISDNIHNFYFVENSDKRPRASSDYVDVQNQKKRNVKPKKTPNVKINSSKPISCGFSEGNGDYTDNNNSESQSVLSKSQSQDVSNGKGKGCRGSARDPQSLYARERKNNERLRILQNLDLNGTKVDISTMLEAAVQYVKFLQLQIKLLSSDYLWMYAPIAYNGMDIGIDMSIPIPTSTTTSS